jgi:hypothetical protein
MLSVGGGWGGKKVRFESEEFNDRSPCALTIPNSHRK